MVEQETHNLLVRGSKPCGPKFRLREFLRIFLGDWLSWLERHIHIVDVIGSSPISPI